MKAHHVVLGSARSIAGTVYGTIVVMSVVAAGAELGRTDPARLAGLAASTAIVFWLAHVYAHALETSVRSQRRLTARRLTEVARHESAIPLAAVVPTVSLVLGAMGVFRETTAIWIALLSGVATLGVVGARYAAIENLGRLGTLLSIAANLALGLAIVGLKAGLGH